MGHCGNCYYFDKGMCRRYPPVLTPQNVVDNGSWLKDIAVLPMWPNVLPTDWCGEYKDTNS